MADAIDRAADAIKEAHEMRAAILISVLAAALAVGEMQEKSAQNRYMAAHIQVSDDFAFYQAKTMRMNLYALHAETLAALPNAADPTIAREIADARATVTRLDTEKDSGRRDILAQSDRHKEEREHFAHRYELFEIVVGALQIAIVLASVSVVTRTRPLFWGAGAIGVGAIAAGVLVFVGAL